MIPTLTLMNGIDMPQLGLGVWQAEDGIEVQEAVETAIETGYRLIDTATIYGNERGVGHAIIGSGVDRKDLFVTTKVWNSDQGYDSTLKAFDTSLSKLKTDYIDLYLIHWPAQGEDAFVDTWRALETICNDGRARSIGVSNFSVSNLEALQARSEIVPMVNQIELHPHKQQRDIRRYCGDNDIIVESYSPLMRGGVILKDPILTSLASTYHKTPAQVILRWHIQHGLVVIPKSVTPTRIRENADIFDFALTSQDMASIDALQQ